MSSSGRLLRPYFRKQWPALAGATASTLFLTVADLAKPWPLKLVLDRILDAHTSRPFQLGEHDLWLLGIVAGLVLAIAVTDAVASYVGELWLQRAGERIVHDLRTALYTHLQRLSLAFHERHQTGDLVTRVTGDVNAVGGLFANSLGTVASAILLLTGMLVVSLLLDPVLAMAAFAITPPLAMVTSRYRRKVKKMARLQRAKEGQIASIATETLSSMRVIKAFGSEDFEQERVNRHSEERREVGIRAARYEARFGGLVDVLGSVATALVLALGVIRVASGLLTPGDLVVFTTYTRKLYGPLRDIAKESSKIASAMARGDRIAEILSADEMLEDRPGAFQEGRAAGTLELDSVAFAYDSDRPVFNDLSLQIQAGSRVAVVGSSGAGKSTLGTLIARFYDPSSGRVLVDGRDARDCALGWLRDQIGLVLQDTMLFTGSVADNIAYGIDARREDVIASAKAAGAHSFISELPEGYDTVLGPRGVGLSGGQRQRIAIARTILRNPPMLVLDEPTTGLDAESEAQVMDGLATLMRGRTTILITHSLALTRSADRIVVLDDGRIVQEGTPKGLLEVPGPFRRLAVEQGLVSRASRPAAPVDAALPRMERVLDPEAMAMVLQASLGPDADLPDVRVKYLRYKPGTKLIVHYDVGIGERWYDAVATIAASSNLARRTQKPEHLMLAGRVNGRSPARAPLSYAAEIDAMIEWLPLDLKLPALAEPPEQLVQRLRAAGLHGAEHPGEPLRLAYKPERRAVLRVGDHVIKLYASEPDFLMAATGLRASSSLQSLKAARFESALADLRLTVQAALPGQPSQAPDVAEDAGAILAALHRSSTNGLTFVPPDRQLQAAVASAGLVEVLAPTLRSRLQTLLARLEIDKPEAGPFVPSHGDFHAGQLLSVEGDLILIDFDEMCLAPAALDLATYAAHQVRGEADDPDVVAAALDELVDGYGDCPSGLQWYVASAILRRTPFPFRYLDEHWPERIEAMVSAAEDALVGDRLPGSRRWNLVGAGEPE